MTTAHAEQAIPQDTLAMRLVIARVYAGHHNAASAALACGTTRQNWARWERGQPMRHAEALIPHIAAALGVDEDWLRNGGPLAPQNGPQPGGETGGRGTRHAVVTRHCDRSRLQLILNPRPGKENDSATSWPRVA